MQVIAAAGAVVRRWLNKSDVLRTNFKANHKNYESAPRERVGRVVDINAHAHLCERVATKRTERWDNSPGHHDQRATTV